MIWQPPSHLPPPLQMDSLAICSIYGIYKRGPMKSRSVLCDVCTASRLNSVILQEKKKENGWNSYFEVGGLMLPVAGARHCAGIVWFSNPFVIVSKVTSKCIQRVLFSQGREMSFISMWQLSTCFSLSHWHQQGLKGAKLWLDCPHSVQLWIK